jgi:hypothetical protein
MAKRLYRRTAKGTAVWQRQDSRVPLEFRRILGIVDGDMHPDSMRGRLPFTDIGLHQLLEDLVEAGFLEAVDASESNDLDFTSSLNFSDLRKTAAIQ